MGYVLGGSQVFMFLMPFSVLAVWVVGLLSLALLGGGAFGIWQWASGASTLLALAGGGAMLILALLGRFLVLLLRPAGQDEPKQERTGTVERVMRPDGTELHVELYGPPTAPPILLTHGWGTDSTEWYYLRERLAERFRLIVWDLRGLGLSSQPPTQRYEIEEMARDLEAVLALAGGRPALLVGHSIGGMSILTFCRLFPEHLGRAVAGIVLLQTTYTKTVRTTLFAPFFTAIQKPLLEPLLHLMIWFSPLVRLLNWISYLNGSAHLQAAFSGFAGTETRGQLDFATRYVTQASPAVLARGVLATFRYDESATLATIAVPTMVISGDHDRVTVPEASGTMRQAIPTAGHVQLQPAGHMGLLERPEQLIDAVTRFADRTLGQAAGA